MESVNDIVGTELVRIIESVYVTPPRVELVDDTGGGVATVVVTHENGAVALVGPGYVENGVPCFTWDTLSVGDETGAEDVPSPTVGALSRALKGLRGS